MTNNASKLFTYPLILSLASISLLTCSNLYAVEEPLFPILESVFLTPNDMKWGTALPDFPVGAQMARLEGNIDKIGLYTIRIKLPANYKFSPHTYKMDTHITVISGALHIARGNTFDTKNGKELSVGSYAIIRSGDAVYAWTTNETVLEVEGIGPLSIQYVNSIDDPRK